MIDKLRAAFDVRVRAYLYRVLLALVPVLTVYGVLTTSTAPLWVGVAAAVLGLGTAAVNTPPAAPPSDDVS